MLKKIISITGKPGLYRLLTQGRGTLIVENISDGHRFPIHSRDKVVSLGDISMYTDAGDTPLNEILEKVKVARDGKEVDGAMLKDNKALRELFASIIEDYDRDRVRDSDLKKFFSWYNLLMAAGLTEFIEESTPEETKDEATPAEANNAKAIFADNDKK